MSTHIDVLVVSYLSNELTQRAARAVAGPGTHIFVHDNSGDLDVDDIADLAKRIVSSEKNLFYARANNDLFALCDAPFVLLLNPDAYCTNSQLHILMAALEADEGAWGVAPMLVNPDGSVQRYYRRLPTTASILADRAPALRGILRRAWSAYLYEDLDVSQPGAVEAPPGACLLLRRDRVGEFLFDERYPLFFNDTDLARRLNRSGRCLLAPQVKVEHIKGACLVEERRVRPLAVARSYDESALTYARANLPYWPVLVPVVWFRRMVSAVLVAGYATSKWIRSRAGPGTDGDLPWKRGRVWRSALRKKS